VRNQCQPGNTKYQVAAGKAEVHVKGIKSTRPGFFDRKKRFIHVAVQSTYKEAYSASSMCIGQELYNDAALPLWMRQITLNSAAKAFSNTAIVDVEGTPR